MQSRFEALPVEVIEMFVGFLEPYDIGSLRLASRTVAEKASKGIFTSFFIRKDIKLSVKSLETMIQVTRRGCMGCLLKHCTITGIAGWVKITKDEEDKFSSLLSGAFSNLKQNSGSKSIMSLHLSVTVDPMSRHFQNWWLIWAAAESTFNIVMPALCKSKLTLEEELDIFASVKGCSLNCKMFQDFVGKVTATTYSFPSLKKFRLSLSVRCQDTEDSLDPNSMFDAREDSWQDMYDLKPFDIEDANEVINSTATLRCIPSLLRIMPDLESLDLHWYGMTNAQSDLADSSAHHEEDRRDVVPLTKSLRHCALRGILTSESQLTEFIETVTPTMLTLTYIRLVRSDTYDGIFKYLADPNSPIQEYCLDDLISYVFLLHYQNTPGTSKFPYEHGFYGPTKLVRLATDAKKVIQYRVEDARPKPSQELEAWVKETVVEYGPPTRDYDFVKSNKQ